jgi:hypothetical protein
MLCAVGGEIITVREVFYKAWLYCVQRRLCSDDCRPGFAVVFLLLGALGNLGISFQISMKYCHGIRFAFTLRSRALISSNLLSGISTSSITSLLTGISGVSFAGF